MSKHKHTTKSRHHKNIVGGILAAAFAFAAVVAVQVTGVDTGKFNADMASDCAAGGGSWNASTNSCTPAGGGTQQTGYAAFTCPNGTSFPAGTGTPPTCPTTPSTIACSSLNGEMKTPAECDAADVRKNACVSPSVWSGSNGGTCTAAATTTTTPTPTCSGATPILCSNNTCATTQASCPTTTTTTTTQTCPAGQYLSGSTCVPSSTTTGTQSWPSINVTWNALGVTSMVCTNAPQAEIDARKLIVKDLTNAQIYWPNGSDCSRTDERAGFPKKSDGSSTACPSGQWWDPARAMCSGTTTNNTPCPTGQWWDSMSNSCKSSTSTTCSGGQWMCGNGQCSVNNVCPTQTTNVPYSSAASKYVTEPTCTSAGYFWGPKSRWCFNTRVDLDNGERNAGTSTWDTTKTWDGTYSSDQERRDKESCNSRGGTWTGDGTNHWCEENTYNWNNQPMPYGMNGTMMPMPPAFGYGNEGGFYTDGNFVPPTWDAQQLKDQYSQYGFDEGAYEFDKFQINWDAEYQGPKIQNRAQEVKRVQREGKGKAREIAQFKKEFERAKGRSGGNTVCPAIANAEAALSNAEAVVELMTNATEDTIEQAMTAQGQLFGNWENPNGIWNEVMQAIQGAHQCEQLAQMQKDGGREVKQMTKELSRVRDAETKAFLQTTLDQFSNVVNNLGDYYVPCDGGYGPCDPMEEARYAMDDLRMAFWDAMRDQHEDFQYDDVCGNFDMIREHLSEADDIPEDILEKASGLLNRGVAYCADGNIDGATRVLGDMERLKNEFDGGGGDEMQFGRDAQDYLREAIQYEDYEDDIDEDALLARMEAIINARVEDAVNRITQQFALKIAEMESTFAAKLAKFQAAALQNISIGFEGELRDAIVEAKTEVSEAVADLDQVLVAIEEQDVEISTAVQEEIEAIYEFGTVHNMTEEAAAEFKAEIDAASNELIVAFQENPEAAGELLAEVIPALREEAERIYEEDKDAQLESGILAFGDLHGEEDTWYTGWATAAKNADLLNGQVDPATGERVMNADAPVNLSEVLTTLGRVAAGGEANVPDEVDLSNPIVREMPDYAQAPLTYLLREGKITEERLAEIYGNSNPGDAATRIEMIELVADVLDLPTADTSVLSDFPDVSKLDAEARAAAAAVVGLEIVGGEGNGTFNPDGFVNRGAFSKIIVGSQNEAIDLGLINMPDPTMGIPTL